MADKFEKKELKKKSENLSDWYTDVVQKAEIAEYGPAKGTMIIRPYGYGIWKRVQEILGGMINDGGVEDAYFPLFFPYSLLEKEKEDVKRYFFFMKKEEGNRNFFSFDLKIKKRGGGEGLAFPFLIKLNKGKNPFYMLLL